MKSNFKITFFLIVLYSFIFISCDNKDKTPIVTYTVEAVTNKDYRIKSKILTESKNPSLTLKRGETYQFDIKSFGHPFYIKTEKTRGKDKTYDEGVTNNGIDDGVILFSVPKNAPDLLFYVCKYHAMMGGELKIVD